MFPLFWALAPRPCLCAGRRGGENRLEGKLCLPAWAPLLGEREMSLCRSILVRLLSLVVWLAPSPKIRSSSNLGYTSCSCSCSGIKYQRALSRLFCKNVCLMSLLVKKHMECQQWSGKEQRKTWITSLCLCTAPWVLCEPFHRDV